MVILVIDPHGVMLVYAVLLEQTVYAQYYCTVLEHNQRSALRNKRRHFLHNPPIIVHDKARTHRTQTVADVFIR